MRPELRPLIPTALQYRLLPTGRHLLATAFFSALLWAPSPGQCAQPVYRLDSAVYHVREGDGAAEIWVVRYGGLELQSAVAYATVAGTAKGGDD